MRRGLAAPHQGDRAARCSAPRQRRRARRRGRAARRARSGGRPSACSTGMQRGGNAGDVGGRARSAPPAAGRRSSAAARRITATSPTTNAAARLGRAEPGGDDLRADAAGVAHRQRERQRSDGSHALIVGAAALAIIGPTHSPARDAQGLAPVLADRDRRGRAAVRRRDAEARVAASAAPSRSLPPGAPVVAAAARRCRASR